MGNATRFAAIDIGSNTFRLMIAEASDKATPWCIIHYTHNIIRLGEGLHHSGRLCQPAMTRALAAFHAYAELLAYYQVDAGHTFAVATAAMREADNGIAFRDQVQAKTSINIQIIDGEKEADMSLAGCCAVLKEATQIDMLLFDIGGASTEFIRAEDAISKDAISRKMGVVRLVETYLQSDPPSAADYLAMCASADAHLAEVETFWTDQHRPHALVGTAGTLTTLAAIALDMFPYDADVINNYSMSRSEFETLRDRLLTMTQAERESLRSLEAERADLIVAGLAIIDAIMQRWDYESMIVVDAGLLEGAWLKLKANALAADC
ncbi:MAG: Ppx/GppA family phosphatase [Mariprofundus sp.]|nr:Ppx/GppA family phosphatase [Mariprofundus sp.]